MLGFQPLGRVALGQLGATNVILAALLATETNDVMAGTLYAATGPLLGARVSIIEIVPKYATVSTAYPAATFANVAIIEVSS